MTPPPNLIGAIDEAARDLTASDPPAHLRTRAMARLGERRTPRWPRMTAAVCAAGLAIAVMLLLRERPAPQHAEQSPVVRESEASVTPRPPQHVITIRNSQAGKPKSRPTPARPATRTSPDILAWQADAVPALAAPARPRMDDIQPELLEIRPLVTTPLTVPALDEGADEASAVER